MALPRVAIIGRPNVGKSSLLNALAGEMISIVEPTAGVTRDRVSTIIGKDDRYFELIDTGGYGIIDREDLSSHIEQQIRQAIESANLVVFMVDIRDGLVPLDEKIARLLRKQREHIIQLIVNDGLADSQPDEVVVEVLPSMSFSMRFTPTALNPEREGKWVKAHFVLPEGYVVEDVNSSAPARIEPSGIESEYVNVFVNEEGLVEVEAGFDPAAFCQAGLQGQVIEVAVSGLLADGQYFCGADQIKVTNNILKHLAGLASYWLEQGCGEPEWCGGFDVDRNSAVDFVDFAVLDGCCIEVAVE
ncbi:MAG: GTPase [Planctomycetota bacterium]|jgi:small GTP-binding protein